MPLPVGPINDYGQTLEAAERSQLLGYMASLEEKGLRLVYLATWRDPFNNPGRYAQEVFHAWGLSEYHALLVFARGEDRRWRVAFHAGSAAPVPPEVSALLTQAESEANRARPGYAALRLAAGLLSALEQPTGAAEAPRPFPWKYVLLGAALLGGGILLGRRICPRCGWFLRRRESFGGILWVCPRCRYTRAGWGRRSGSRRGVFP